MRLETVSKIKGCVALGMMLMLPTAWLFQAGAFIPAWLLWVVLVSPIVGICVGISWLRQRNWMRRQSYAARQVLGR